MAAVSPHFKPGALRPIAVFEKERLKEFSHVPTFSGLGYPVIIFIWYGFFAPKELQKKLQKQSIKPSKK
jgi:tripartite-type tricarboxylate transporter receptor subunit TctC